MYDRLTDWLRDHVILASLLVFFCSAFVRVGLAWRMDSGELVRMYADAGTYIVPANSLLQQGSFTDRYGLPDVFRTPGYPAFLAALLFVTNGSLRIALIAQAAILSFTVLFLYLFARKILPSATAFTGAMIASLSPWGAVHAGVPMTEGLYLLILSMMFFLLKIIEESSSKLTAFSCAAFVGVLSGWAVLVRPVAFLIVVIAGTFLFLNGALRKRLVAMTIMLAFAATPIVFWIHRNATEARYVGLSTVSWATAWHFLAQRVRAKVDGESHYAYSTSARKETLNLRRNPNAYETATRRRAMAVFRDHPFWTAYCFIVSAAEHMLHPGPRVLEATRLEFPGSFWMLASLWGTMLILAGLGFGQVLGREGNDAGLDRVWLFILFGVCALLTLPSGVSFGTGTLSRLRAPMELIVPLLVALGLVQLTKWIPARSRGSHSAGPLHF